MAPLLAQRSRTDRGFERIYRRHVGDVYRYALAVMRHPADAEDVTQTTFLNAYRAYVEKGERPAKPQNWLIAIAHNVCRQRFRQSARRPAEVTFDDDIADTFVDDETPSGEDIRRALGQLAFNQRAALVMRELEGRSYAEIANILGVSIGAVETLIFRARRALREQLEGSLTCGEAEFAISRQLDGRLSRHEKAQLRAHLRECDECARFARRQRAQRGALKSLGLVPVPSSLASLFGGGGAAVGSGLALKAAAAVVAGAVIGSAGYEGVRHAPWRHAEPAAAAKADSKARAKPVTNFRAVLAGAGAVAREHSRQAVALATPGRAKAKAARAVHGRARGHNRSPASAAKAKAHAAAGLARGHTAHPTGRGHAKTRAVGKSAAPGRLKTRVRRTQTQRTHTTQGTANKPAHVPKRPKPRQKPPLPVRTEAPNGNKPK
jgi:RNA polymerase sigma factor (sigma-70 family)